MIKLTRLNNSLLVINSDLIQYVESAPDTTLTLLNGEKVVVRESTDEVINLTIAFRARLMGEASRHCPGGAVVHSGAALQALSAQNGSGDSNEIKSTSSAAARRRRAES